MHILNVSWRFLPGAFRGADRLLMRHDWTRDIAHRRVGKDEGARQRKQG
jgi:hypothetical protein